jgi:hypothetical protein
MMTQPDHTDVAAYVLGLLDEAEMTRFEEHMIECDRCAEEAEELIDLPVLLQPLVAPPPGAHRADADAPDPFRPTPPADAVTAEAATADAATANAVAADAVAVDATAGTPARPRRQRRTLTLAAAVALLAAGSFVGLGVGRHLGSPPTSVAADLVMMGEQHKATDPATGVSAVIGLESVGWGTHVAIQLAGVHGPLKCNLIAVSKSGEDEVVTNWIVPSPGYGVPGHEQALVVHGGAAMAPSDIDHFVVRTFDGKDLITIPM